MSREDCIDNLQSMKSRLSADDYKNLLDMCYKNDDRQIPPPPPVPFTGEDGGTLLGLGIIGLGGTGIVVGAVAVAGVAAVGLIGATYILGQQPSTVTTSYNRDNSGNVQSQTTTVT
jgi:hypothetical protein